MSTSETQGAVGGESTPLSHTPGPWTAAPEMLAEIERLRDALALLIGTIDAHEIESLQCDRNEERYCNCLRENAARAKALLPAQQCAQEQDGDE